VLQSRRFDIGTFAYGERSRKRWIIYVAEIEQAASVGWPEKWIVRDLAPENG
jgi:hypothetical protein